MTIVCGMHMGFPHGGAATSRVAAYARGLRAAGIPSQIILLQPSEIPSLGVFNHKVRGEYEGIAFEYSCGRTVWGRSFRERRWLDLKGLVRGTMMVARLRPIGDQGAVLLYGENPLIAFALRLASRRAGLPLLAEVSELPFVRARRRPIVGRLARGYEPFAFRVFDGAIVVTERLERHVAPLLPRGAGIVRVPVLVDLDAFAGDARGGAEEREVLAGGSQARSDDASLGAVRRVVYCGMLNEEKDGVATLMRAFAALPAELSDVRLELVGDSYQASRIPEFRAIGADLGIEARVDFVGTVPRDALRPYLAQATVLALARPSSLQAAAGFPTKLAEYLASGRPVVVTRTSEIDRFLSDGESAYLVPPDDWRAFAAALRIPLEHPAEAEAVGREGRRVAEQVFDYRLGGRVLAEFVRSLAPRARRVGKEAGA